MTKATWRLVIGAVAMLGIATTQLDVSAFAQEPRKAPAKMSVKIPMTFNLPIAKPAIRWSDSRSTPAAPAGSGGSKKKWILLAVAAGGGGAAIYFATKKEETPTITVGPPTIGFQFGHR